MTSPNTEYKLLEEILADLILEEQAKLGYRKESIRFYFPLSSLRHIFKMPPMLRNAVSSS